MQDLDQDPSVHAIVLRGAGRSFCAGNDLRESANDSIELAHQRSEEYFLLYDTIRSLTKPLIVSIHGHCAGAALQISLLADLRIGGSDAKIGMTELNVGMPVVIGSSLLRAVVGEAVMRRLVLLADFIPSEQALTFNLLNEVVPNDELDARVTDDRQWNLGKTARRDQADQSMVERDNRPADRTDLVLRTRQPGDACRSKEGEPSGTLSVIPLRTPLHRRKQSPAARR